MLNCLIVDDEPLARQVLENYISRTPLLQLTATCSNAVDAYRILQEQTINVAFLDIKMPLINGISFLRSLKQPPAVIFTTAFAEYAAESYDLNAIDYLLKPFSYERFYRSIEKALKINPLPQEEDVKNYLFIKVDNNLIKLFHQDILYVEARKDYLKLVTKGSSYLTHMTMKYIESLLPKDLFIRIHRSYIICLASVSVRGKNFVDIDNVKIPVSDSYRTLLDEALRKKQG
ncbi:MAG: LytTR family DNA-binding domain-containing protein [Chitinophagaceae bacterium]